VALLMTAYLLFARLHDKLSLIALCMVVGGAAGNLLDRVLWGRVVDFIEIGVGEYTWPVFNVADMAVTAGAVLLGWSLLRAPAPKQASKTAESGSESDGE
jgi:signal peptidase II